MMDCSLKSNWRFIETWENSFFLVFSIGIKKRYFFSIFRRWLVQCNKIFNLKRRFHLSSFTLSHVGQYEHRDLKTDNCLNFVWRPPAVTIKNSKFLWEKWTPLHLLMFLIKKEFSIFVRWTSSLEISVKKFFRLYRSR